MVSYIKAGITAANGTPQHGITVNVFAGNNGPPSPVVASGVTDLEGNAFISLIDPSGNYTVRQVLPSGYQQQIPASNLGVHLNPVEPDNDYLALFINTPVAPVPVPPTPTITTTIGINSGGANDPTYDPSKHAQINAVLSETGLTAGNRFWGTDPLKGSASSSQWSITSKLSLSICVLVLNFQNSVVRCKAPAMTDWLSYLNSLPPSSVTRITHIEIGNEIDSAGYYNDTPEAYAALVKAAYPLLHAKGYKLILANTFSVASIQKWATLCKGNYDAIGGHFYNSNAADSLAQHKAAKALANSLGVAYISTETGLHGSNSNLTGWAAEITKLIIGLRQIGGTYLYFSLFAVKGAAVAADEGLLNADYSPNNLFIDAIKAAA